MPASPTDGSLRVAQAVTSEQRPQVMYNLTVAEAHTFLVGDGKWLAHNAGCKGANYPNSTWNKGNDFGDFKPATPGGKRTFGSDVRKGKLPANTQPLPYDPATGKFRRTTSFHRRIR